MKEQKKEHVSTHWAIATLKDVGFHLSKIDGRYLVARVNVAGMPECFLLDSEQLVLTALDYCDAHRKPEH